MSNYPITRLRRLRRTVGIRRMLDLPLPGPEKFVWPMFIADGHNRREAIAALPGQYRLSPDRLLEELEPAATQGIGGVLLFGVPDAAAKSAVGDYAAAENGAVQTAIRHIRRAFPELIIISDVCLCAYTDHGHCGILAADGSVDNDATNQMLAQVAISQAAAGADVVAPSAMMDGQVMAIRQQLDQTGFSQTMLMSYSTKFASAMYGPFREAENSSPKHGNRQAYQASYADLRQALRESELDEYEGADILMVKPALFYLDIIARLRDQTKLPLAAYNVSGEYAMLIATADRGWGDLGSMVRESIAAMTRAGTDIFISYWANRYRELIG